MWVGNPTLAPTERIQPAPIAIQRVLPAIAPGTALNVLVAGSLRSGAYELLVNGQRLRALSEHKLEVGGRYNLQVAGFDKSGQVILRPMSESSSQLQAAIQHRLSSQLEPTRLLQALFSLAGSETPLAQSKEVASFLGAFAQRRNIRTGEGLAARIEKSGLLFERLLAQSPTLVGDDLKGLLLKLRAFLAAQPKQAKVGLPPLMEEGDAPSDRQTSPAPSSGKPQFGPSTANAAYHRVSSTPQRPFNFTNASVATDLLNIENFGSLLRAVEGAIARIEAQQLLSMQAQQQQQTYLLLELPVVDRDRLSNWHIHMRDEPDTKARTSEDAKHWTVVLSVELPAIGPLFIKLSHSEQSTEAIFYSERQPVCGLLAKILPEFSGRLSRLGFNEVRLSSHFGKLPEADEPNIGYPSLHAQA